MREMWQSVPGITQMPLDGGGKERSDGKPAAWEPDGCVSDMG